MAVGGALVGGAGGESEGGSAGIIGTGGVSTAIWRFDAGDTGLPETSATAPPDTDRVGESPAVDLWAASSVAVMVRPEWLLEATSSRATLPVGPTTLTPE